MRLLRNTASSESINVNGNMAASGESAVKAYAAEILKQHRYKSTALAQLRTFESAWKESKERARHLMDAGVVPGAVKISIAPGADVFVIRKQRSISGAVTKKRIEVYTSRAFKDSDMDELRRIADEVHADAKARSDREAAKQAKEAASRAKKEQREAAKRQREEAEAQRKRAREVRDAAKAEQEEAKRARLEAKKAASAARDAYERRVRQVQRVIQQSGENVSTPYTPR